MFAETDKGLSESKTDCHAKIFDALGEEKTRQISWKPLAAQRFAGMAGLPPWKFLEITMRQSLLSSFCCLVGFLVESDIGWDFWLKDMDSRK